MNILVLGNGFDLAHGLPTKYSDFLEFAKVMQKKISNNKTLEEIDWNGVSDPRSHPSRTRGSGTPKDPQDADQRAIQAL